MKNLIYQLWDGNVTVGVRAGVAAMKEYATRIGADHVFVENLKWQKNLGSYSPHYGKFRPIYVDEFQQYDNVLVCDTDVFPVDGLTESPFEGFKADFGLCTEPFQPAQRAKIKGAISKENDEKWAAIVEKKWNVKMPRTPERLLKVYNSGFMLWSNAGMQKARERFVPFIEYVNMINAAGLPGFYTCDQPYVHAMMHVCQLDWIELDNEWNRYVHHYYTNNDKKHLKLMDPRTPNTKMVHIQLRTADHWDADKLWRVTNLPNSKWNL